MSSSDRTPSAAPSAGGTGDGAGPTPGKPMTMGSTLMEMGTEMLQSMGPCRQIRQHACTFALYSHDLSRQMEVHLFATRLNEDVLQCAVYDSDDSTARLIGVEYVISDRLYETLSSEEQRMWHSHAYEVKSGLWLLPRVPETAAARELQFMAKTYGKMWCTWQVDRGDRLPLGAPALMVSPQGAEMGAVNPELVKKREERYGAPAVEEKGKREEMEEPEWINPNADYWKQHWKGFAVDVVEASRPV